ncbi:MAG TPA: hypothetical protein VEW94_02565 [Chloroflexia bacterium]|nr:hypothetical protein [Chloroflexia bacterium]
MAREEIPLPSEVVLPGDKRRSTLSVGIVGLAVALTAIALYLPTLGHYFVADDFIFLHQLHFSQHAFTDSFAYFGRDWGMGAQFYRPLTRVLWAGEYSLFGESAMGWHLAGTLLYSATALLVFLLAWRLSRRLILAGIAGLLFSLHPAHAETVSWVANQSDLLVGIFCVGGTLLYVQARREGEGVRRGLLMYGGALGCFMLALLSKESAAGFLLVPLLYDVVFGLFSGATRQARVKSLLPFVARQAPFWVLFLLYLGVRVAALGGVGGYTPGSLESAVPMGVFVESYTRWLFMPLSLDRTLFRLALLVVIGALFAYMVVWEAKGYKKRTEEGQSKSVLPFRHTRTAIFGVVWTLLFLLPTISTPPSLRFVYLSTVGLALTLAALIAPLGALNKWVSRQAWRPDELSIIGATKLGMAALLLALSLGAAVSHQGYWARASQTAHDILGQMRQHRPELDNYAYVYAANLPEANEEALIFRTGFPEAVQMLYDNTTVLGLPVPAFPVVEEHLNEAYFVEYKNGVVVPRDDLIEALQERNRNIKGDKQQPFLTWDAGDWTLLSGNGMLTVEGSKLNVTLSEGGTIRPPAFALPAPALAELELEISAIHVKPGDTAAQLVVHWLVSSQAGSVERASAPLVIEADGEMHTYKIKPPGMLPFLYEDTVSEIHLELPTGLATVQVERATLYRLP